MSKIFNPLYDSVCSDTKLEATSSLINDVLGVCPKCKQPFGSGIVANSDTVYYCPACRVSQPCAK